MVLVSWLAIPGHLSGEKSNTINNQTREMKKFDYLGQKPPGNIPEIFAPGTVSTKNRDHSDLLFYPTGKEIYWSVALSQKSAAIMVARYKNGEWLPPQIARFSLPQYFDCIPCLSPDGKTLYFSSRRPIKMETRSNQLNIWKVNRDGETWSVPVVLSDGVNHPGHDSNPVLARNGNLYFGSDRAGGQGSWDIYCSEYMNGRFGPPKNLGQGINSKYIEIVSFIDPAEKFIIFTAYSRPKGSGNGDIYVGFKNETGKWEKVIKLGDPINTKFEEAFGIFSPDKKFFFFSSSRKGNMDVYWVDAKVIKEFKLIQ